MKKKVLIDLTVLKHINCGLGQIAYNYARYWGENAKNMEFEITFLVPKQYVGCSLPDPLMVVRPVKNLFSHIRRLAFNTPDEPIQTGFAAEHKESADHS